jgi:RNA polymerase sigma-70 factor (ECF subfamily)
MVMTANKVRTDGPIGSVSARHGRADARIVAGLRRREADALEHLFSKYGRMIAHWARTEGQEAEDVVQEVLLKVWRSGDSLAPDTHLPGWLRTVTNNTVRNRWRTKDRKPQVPVGLAIDNAESADPTPDSDDRIAIEQALGVLNDRERACLELLYRSDMPLADVAQRLGSSTEATKSLAARARRRIRAELEKSTSGAAGAAALPLGGQSLWQALQAAGLATATKVATTAVAVVTAGALVISAGSDPTPPTSARTVSSEAAAPTQAVPAARPHGAQPAAASAPDQAIQAAPAPGRGDLGGSESAAPAPSIEQRATDAPERAADNSDRATSARTGAAAGTPHECPEQADGGRAVTPPGQAGSKGTGAPVMVASAGSETRPPSKGNAVKPQPTDPAEPESSGNPPEEPGCSGADVPSNTQP